MPGVKRAFEAVQTMATRAATTLAHVKEVLERYYWGVWGSVRRIKASAREVSVLTDALREAEWGAGDDGLPRGSTWLAVFEALVGEAGARVGGGRGVAVGAVVGGAGDDGSDGNDASGGTSWCNARGDTTVRGGKRPVEAASQACGVAG
eukprot:SAG11_NODE_1884_length_4122_cov_4.172011_1_plen_149_part_00